MNLIELFDGLEIPTGTDANILSAIPLPDYPQFRVATNAGGDPILLFKTTRTAQSYKLKSIRLKYLSLTYDVECKIIEKGNSSLHTFTIITFAGSDRGLREYFLRVAETLIKSLAVDPTDRQIADSLFRFVEIFQALSAAPSNTIQGLWAELFLIDASKRPGNLIHFWHSLPEEKFDFNAGDERIEVKSSESMERVHSFSAGQLCPPDGVQVLIASVLLKQTNAGKDIQQLTESISARLGHRLDIVEKLHAIVSRTLGSSLTNALSTKYDYTVAHNSLRFYRHQDIYKIALEHIPPAVTEVRYRSDLSSVPHVVISNFSLSLGLFNCF